MNDINHYYVFLTKPWVLAKGINKHTNSIARDCTFSDTAPCGSTNLDLGNIGLKIPVGSFCVALIIVLLGDGCYRGILAAMCLCLICKGVWGHGLRRSRILHCTVKINVMNFNCAFNVGAEWGVY